MQGGTNSNDLLSLILSSTNLLDEFPEHIDALSLALTSKDLFNTVSWEYNKRLPNRKVIAVAAGDSHSLFLTSNGKVLSCGDGSDGKLGHGSELEYDKPTEILGLHNTELIAAGTSHSLFLTHDGKVFSCGNGANGGHGNRENYLTPTEIPNLPAVVQIVASRSHSLFLTREGKVFSCGNRNYGQLGHGNTNSYLKPTEILNTDNIVHIAGGISHILLLTKDGKVLSCGRGAYGALGHGNENDYLAPTEIPNLNKIVQIAAGTFHSLFLTNDGIVFSCGSGLSGALGHGNTNDCFTPREINIPGRAKIVKIVAGGSQTLLLAEDGSVLICGVGEFGHFGPGKNEERYLTPTMIPVLSNVIRIAAGSAFSLFLTKAGNILRCGAESSGQLEHRHLNRYLTPTKNPYLKAPFVNETNTPPLDEASLSTRFKQSVSFMPSFLSLNNVTDQNIQRPSDEQSNDLDERATKRKWF